MISTYSFHVVTRDLSRTSTDCAPHSVSSFSLHFISILYSSIIHIPWVLSNLFNLCSLFLLHQSSQSFCLHFVLLIYQIAINARVWICFIHLLSFDITHHSFSLNASFVGWAWQQVSPCVSMACLASFFPDTLHARVNRPQIDKHCLHIRRDGWLFPRMLRIFLEWTFHVRACLDLSLQAYRHFLEKKWISLVNI